jgi:hypothetical protein
MATNRTMQSGDTFPPLKGLAADDEGPVDLTLADSMRALLKSNSALIELPATVINPIQVDGAEAFNWEAAWDAGDTDIVGHYLVQLEVTWSPGQIETFPNNQAGAPTVTIERANDD